MVKIKRKHPLAQCEECPLYDRPYVPTTYKANATLAILPEAPGREEVVQQAYLVGASGKVLFSALAQVGIKREDCALFNSAMCYPPQRGKTHTPTDDEIHLCSDERLVKDIVAQKPKLILALGNSAMIALFGSKGRGIMKERGQLREWHGIKVLPSVHPASMLHGGGAWTDFAADIERIPRILAGETFEHTPPKVQTITTDRQFNQLIEKIKAKTPCEIACDIETTGFDYLHDEILCVSISVSGTQSFVIARELCTKGRLKKLFHIKGIDWTYHNAKFDAQFLRTFLGENIPFTHDTMLKSYTLDERQGVHGLKHQATERLNAPDYEAEIRKYLPNKNSSYTAIPTDVLYKYAGYDTGYTRNLSTEYDRLMDQKQRMFYDTVLMPAVNFFMDVEREGMLIDQVRLEELKIELRENLDVLEAQLFECVGQEFNPRSPQQVSEILYQKLSLPRPRSKTATATDEECLEYNRGRHEVIPLMQDYRGEHKNYSTYVVGLEKDIWDDERVHASYLLHGAVSRTSCKDPNVQNMPREGPIKSMFIAPEGWEIFWPDFSQHEFRMVAIYSGDEWLKEVFNTDRSLHKEMAHDVYGPDYSDEDYVHTKNINFGLLFGRGAYSLSLQMKCSVREAQEKIDEFYTRMPKVRPWQDEIIAAVFQGEDLISLLGRYRRFGLITHENIKHVSNEVMNFYPQSTGSDTVLVAGARVHTSGLYDASWMRPIAFVHDAIGYYVKKGNRERLPKIIAELERIPQEVLNTDVRMKVEAKIGDSWATLKDL